MTWPEQEEFGKCVESALSWIQDVHERLRVCDNTEGPRSALQSRLRETEVIRSSEHEGRLKVAMALVAAEDLLQTADGVIKGQTQARLKELKASWEETSIYITNCHSRIEWVWLHWSEYLRALEEFGRWLLGMQQALYPHPEQQLGVREKVWQLEHYRVLLDDVRAREPSLERLLEEASDLHDRTEDPSVGPKARDALREAYSQIRDKAEERVSFLEKIAEEHRVFDASIHKFWVWLDTMSIKLTRCCDPEYSSERRLRPLRAKDTPEDVVSALQELCETVDREEATLQHLEAAAESVNANTSPQGAEKVSREVEELRQAWQRLRQRLRVAEDRQRAAQRARVEHSALCEGLQADASRLLLLLNRLDGDLEPVERERGEDENETQWRKYTEVQRAVKEEEPRVEELKAQLTELFHVSKGPTPLSDQLLAVIKQYEGLRSRAFRLWSKRETALSRLLSDPLRAFNKWTLLVTKVLEASDDVDDLSHITLMVESMEKLLRDSQQLREFLERLQRKGDLLASMFGLQRAKSLGADISTAVRDRNRKHGQLLQRKTHLQDLLSRSNDFGEKYETVVKSLRHLREKLNTTEEELKPDLLSKKALSGELMVILEDLEKHKADLIAMQALVLPGSADQRKLSHLWTEWKELYKDTKERVQESERSSADHQLFQEKLLALERELLETRSILESFCRSTGERGADSWQAEAKRVLETLPEKELELSRVEVCSHRVLGRTSEDGKKKILEDLRHLRDSWTSVQMLSMDLHRCLDGHGLTSIAGKEWEGAGQIDTNLDLYAGEEEALLEQGLSEQDSEDYSGRIGQGRNLWSSREGDSVRPSIGWRDGSPVGNIGHGNGVQTEGGFGTDDEDVTFGQSEIGFGAGDEGGFDDEIDGKSFWRDVETELGLETGDGVMGLDQDLEFKSERLDAGDVSKESGEGVENEAVIEASEEDSRGLRSAASLGAGDEASRFGKFVQTEGVPRSGGEGIPAASSKGMVSMLGFGDEGEFSARCEGTSLDKDVQAEVELRTGDEVMVGAGPVRARRGQCVTVERVRSAAVESVSLSESTQSQESCDRGGEGLNLNQALRAEVSIGSSGFGAEGPKEPGGGLIKDNRVVQDPDLGLNTVEVRTRHVWRQQDTRVSQVKAGVQEMELRSRYSQRTPRYRRERMKQLSGETQIVNSGVSGTESGEVTKDESHPQESGTGLYRLSPCTKEEFEAWLQTETAKLNRILEQKEELSAEELTLRQKELEELRCRVGWGQGLLQGLLTSQGGEDAQDLGLEELRYRWVLYKSKLQDAGDPRPHLKDKVSWQDSTLRQEEELSNEKASSGMLQRVCCCALPLQLLLLSLLLLAFFLPLPEEGGSCSLVNNFARSFRFMLRYQGPPPT